MRLGWLYMQQRYYDPCVGQFWNVDPVTAYSDPVGQFHRYRYADNSPYTFNDPAGEIANFALKAAADFALEVGIQYARTGTVDLGRPTLCLELRKTNCHGSRRRETG